MPSCSLAAGNTHVGVVKDCGGTVGSDLGVTNTNNRWVCKYRILS